MLGLDRFEFDGNLFPRYDVRSKVDVTEASAADLASDAVFVPDAEILEEVVDVSNAVLKRPCRTSHG